MNEVTLTAGEADAGLRATSPPPATTTAACYPSRPAGTVVTYARGFTGGRGAAAATSTCSGFETTSAVMAWEPGSYPPPRRRSGAAAATGLP